MIHISQLATDDYPIVRHVGQTHQCTKACNHHSFHIARDACVCGIDKRQMGGNGLNRAERYVVACVLLLFASFINRAWGV